MAYSIATVCLSGTLREKIEAIGKAGFHAIEIFEQDLVLFDGSVKDVKQLVDDNGLKVITYQPFRDFEGLPEPYRSKVFDRAEHKFDIMGELDCDLLMACSSVHPHAQGGIQRISDDFAELAERAGKRNMRVAYEALSWGKHIHDYRDTWEVVRRADHKALGLCLDTFHIFSRNTEIDSILNIPGEKIFLVQLADAPLLKMDHLSWSRHFRCFPGQGELPLRQFMNNLNATGYDGPLSLEIFNDQFRAGSVTKTARDGYRSLVYLGQQTEGNQVQKVEEVAAPKSVAFLEFSVSDQDYTELSSVIAALGFVRKGTHLRKNVEWWGQGEINLILNMDQDGFAAQYQQNHGASVCAIGLEVESAPKHVNRIRQLNYESSDDKNMIDSHGMPSIHGIGESLIYLVDQEDFKTLWTREFNPVEGAEENAYLKRIDHVAYSLTYEELLIAILQYRSLFKMHASSSFDVVDPAGLVRSQVLQTPDSNVCFTMNSSEAPRTLSSKILDEYAGSGVQHIAMSTQNIFAVAESLANSGVKTMQVTENYYADIEASYHLDADTMEKIRKYNILYCEDENGGFFQLYTSYVQKRFCFEVVQRTGYKGFGAANSVVRTTIQTKQVMTD